MSDPTLQDLLKILETEPEKAPDLVTFSKDEPLKPFYHENSIVAGVDRIPNFMIYYQYKEVWGGHMSKIGFFREFNKDFTQVRTGKQRCYLLSAESFDLSREGLIEASFSCKGKK